MRIASSATASIALLAVAITLVTSPLAWAADDEGTVEAAQTEVAPTTREHILQAIEDTRQTDPELAREMEAQLELLNTGELSPPSLEAPETGLSLGAPPTDVSSSSNVPRSQGFMGSTPLGGDNTNLSERDRLFMQVQSDPRMEDVRRQFEGGQISPDQAREKVFDVLRDYGIEPNEGREWGSAEGRMMNGEGFREGLGMESHPGGERSWEQMSPEAREQMERFFGHEGDSPEDRPEMMHEGFDREMGTSERYFEGRENEYHSGPEVIERERAFESMDRSFEAEAPTHEYESSTHEFESPTHEYQAPQNEPAEHEMPGPMEPPSQAELPQQEYQAPPQP